MNRTPIFFKIWFVIVATLALSIYIYAQIILLGPVGIAEVVGRSLGVAFREFENAR